MNFVLSDYTGKVTKYTNPTGLHTTWYEGKKMGELWGYETYGLFQSEEEIASAPSQSKIAANWYPGDVRYVDLNGDGVIDWGDNTLANPGDKKIISNTTPRYQFGLKPSAMNGGSALCLIAATSILVGLTMGCRTSSWQIWRPRMPESSRGTPPPCLPWRAS